MIRIPLHEEGRWSDLESGTEPLLSADRTGFSRDYYEGHHQIGFRCARPVATGN